MPNGRTHKAIGALGATGVSLVRSEDLPDSARLAYCMGAAAGGVVGGALPDILEPAYHSHHRDFCHSLTAGGGIVAGSVRVAQGLGEELRAEGASLRSIRFGLDADDPGRIELAVREYLIYFLLGFSLGVTVGYASHILADLATPRGVPLLSRHIG